MKDLIVKASVIDADLVQALILSINKYKEDLPLELIGFAVFIFILIMLCFAIACLMILSVSTKANFDGIIRPSNPWPRSDCKCDGCTMVGGYQPCHDKSNEPDLDIKAPKLKRGKYS